MAAQIEARSLAELNHLAANPPQYPVNPSETPRESLVLYISRVPGTRDVILSTYKPQRKNVTGVDVANSLYYVHLDTPQDDMLAGHAPQPVDMTSGRVSIESTRSQIPRKPVPGAASAVAPNDALPGTSPAPLASLDTQAPAQDRPYLPPRPSQQSQSAASPIARKPLGPRAQPASPVEAEHFDAATRIQHFDGIVPENKLPHESADQRPEATSWAHVLARHEASSPFSLTLIRREPSVGHQWNVGRITSIQSRVMAGDAAETFQDLRELDNARAPATIEIFLETSGYAKFRGMPTRESIDTALRPYSSSSADPRTHAHDARADAIKKAAGQSHQWEEGFSRQVAMSYTKTLASNFKDVFRRRRSSSGASDYNTHDELAPPRSSHARHRSTNSAGSADSAGSHEDHDGHRSPTLITQPGPGLRPKGYVFTSPWNGRCEFRTGNAGRSLKLGHRLQSDDGVFNPLLLGQSIRDGQAFNKARNPSVAAALTGVKPVSELRYNLPSTEVRGTSQATGHKHLSQQFSKFLNLDARSSDDDDDDDGPMDLSLGKENAGGGNRGKRAKLGKLIIHAEGLKMMDLVVAANIGVWWKTYERMF